MHKATHRGSQGPQVLLLVHMTVLLVTYLVSLIVTTSLISIRRNKQKSKNKKKKNPDSQNKNHLILFKLCPWCCYILKEKLELIVVKTWLQGLPLFSLRFQYFDSRNSLLTAAAGVPTSVQISVPYRKSITWQPYNITNGRKTRLSYKQYHWPLFLLLFQHLPCVKPSV